VNIVLRHPNAIAAGIVVYVWARLVEGKRRRRTAP
jgi:hypothetical protein